MEDRQNATVLIVDDESDIVDLLTSHVTFLGYTSISASNGEEALEALGREHVDVVVSDLVMPRKSGMGLLQTMVKRKIEVPFIFITGYATQDSTIQALKLGAFDYIEKPFDGEEVRGIIKEAVRVSHEQQNLNSMDKVGESSDTEKQIRQLSALRSGDDLGIEDEPETTGETSEVVVDGEIKRLFVKESGSQLRYCGVAVQGLAVEENRVWEVGYLFRVMQSIRKTAQSLGAQQVVDLAESGEHCFSLLRLKPDSFTEDRIAFLSEFIDSLKVAINGFAEGKEADTGANLKAMQEYSNELGGLIGLEEAV